MLRAYFFTSRKHAFWKIEPPLTSQIAENKILGPIPLDPHEKVSMDAEKNHVEYMIFRIYGEKKRSKNLLERRNSILHPLAP